MFQFTKPSDALQLIRWNKELPSASDADPLGLNLRVSARLANELLYCITSITPRARYYSFFPWALDDYNENERGISRDRGRIQGVLARERGMVLGAVLHHDGLACDGGALGGSKPAKDLAAKGKKSYELSGWRHLQAPEGQFGAAYKGSLINLGMFKAEGSDAAVEDEATAGADELDKSVQEIDVKELSPIGKRLAKSFAASIRRTAYVTESWSLKNTVTADVLKQFGGRAGLCEISGKQASDRAELRSMFFAHEGFLTTGSHHRRRMSLLLLLECIGRAHTKGASFSNSLFSDVCYFGEIAVDEEKPTAVKLPVSLKDISERWRVYHLHNYLTVALQSFLVTIVRVIRGRPGGVARASLFNGLPVPAISAGFQEIFNIDLPKGFFDLTPREMLAISSIVLPSSIADLDARVFSLPLASPFSERSLESHLVSKKEANNTGGIAIAAILFYQVLLRYPVAVPASFNNWYQQHVYDRYTDISVPGILEFLQGEFGAAWVDRPNREILDRVIWRFVVRQHQTMSYERGFGGSAPLFHVDESTIIGTNIDYIDPRADNARLGSALQILADLGLIVWDQETGYSRSAEGDGWLAAELKRESRP